MSNDGNGHNGDIGKTIVENAVEERTKLFAGGSAPLNVFEREDGIIAKAAEAVTRTSGGVLVNAMHAVEDDDHYRQLLIRAYWDNPAQYVRTCAALAECRLIGDTEGTRMIVDVVTAACARVKGGLLNAIFEALTHTTLNLNQRRQKDEHRKNSDSITD